jgi:hypothetical protein
MSIRNQRRFIISVGPTRGKTGESTVVGFRTVMTSETMFQIPNFHSETSLRQTERPPPVSEACTNFADRGMLRSQRGGSLTTVISVFWTEAANLSYKQLHSCTHEAEWTPFQTHYFSENLVVPRIELGPLDL